MTHKISVSSNSYSIKKKSEEKFKVSILTGVADVANLSDLNDVDVSDIQDNYVLIYNSSTGKFVAENPDNVLSGAVAGELPNDFIDKLDVDLDNKIDIDAGTF